MVTEIMGLKEGEGGAIFGLGHGRYLPKMVRERLTKIAPRVNGPFLKGMVSPLLCVLTAPLPLSIEIDVLYLGGNLSFR